AVVLVKALQLQGDGAVLPFLDKDDIGAWAKQPIALAFEARLLFGYEDNSFRPNQPITRAEIAVIVARVLELDTSAYTVTGFADDADIPNWAKGAVGAIRKLGIVSGRGGNKFVPNGIATRAEA